MRELDLAGFIHIKLYIYHSEALLTKIHFINDNF